MTATRSWSQASFIFLEVYCSFGFSSIICLWFLKDLRNLYAIFIPVIFGKI